MDAQGWFSHARPRPSFPLMGGADKGADRSGCGAPQRAPGGSRRRHVARRALSTPGSATSPGSICRGDR